MSNDDTVRLTPAQRQLLLGVCLVVGAAYMVGATYNYLLNPMLSAFGATATKQSLLRQLPSIAALLVLFPAGVLGRRWGERRLITVGAALFTSGSLLVAVAPTFLVVVAGMVVEGMGASALLVVALGLVSSRVADPGARATAFASFAVVGPLVFTLSPVLAGLLADDVSWRLIPGMWTVGGLVMLASCRWLLPADEEPGGSGSLVVPVLAGIVLACLVQTISSISADGWTSTSALVKAGIGLAALVALAVAARRSVPHSLSTAPLRRGGTLILLVVVVLIPFANLWFYMNMAYQYVFGFSVLTTALLMAPAQLAGLLGAASCRKLIQRHGITVAGTVFISLLSLTMLAGLAVTEHTPVPALVGLMCVYAIASVGTGIPVTNAIMNTARPGEEGSAAAFRGAAMNVGQAVGVVVVSALVFGTVASSLATALTAEGLDSTKSDQIARSMRDGSSSEEVAAQYSVPVQEVDQISSAQSTAMLAGLHTQAAAGAAFTAACVLVFVAARRRQERHAAQKPGVEPVSA